MEPRLKDSEEALLSAEEERLRWPGGTLILSVMVSGGGVGAIVVANRDCMVAFDHRICGGTIAV